MFLLAPCPPKEMLKTVPNTCSWSPGPVSRNSSLPPREMENGKARVRPPPRLFKPLAMNQIHLVGIEITMHLLVRKPEDHDHRE